MPRGLGAFLLPLDHVMFLSALASISSRALLPVVAGGRFISSALVSQDKPRQRRLALQGVVYLNSILSH